MVGQDSSPSQGAAPAAPKIVGPNITGTREEYRLERRLQSGLFGGVYEAQGLSSGRMFAVKVLHRSELHKAQRASSLEFCEVPLSEVKFMEVMRGSDHVMQVEDHFEDQYCHYIVFELARGGDLLEALKLRPHGFEEHQAQFLIGQAAKGLAGLHERRLAMQDVSLENMLLHVLDDGEYQVKICDPGQAVHFEVDAEQEEIPVQFHGYVGKSFRPPEIHRKEPYLATKVDAWCVGWSTFYLLAAQPLFLSADPASQDPDWELFEREEFATLFRQKATSCSQKCMDFILRLLVIDPKKRMSVSEALQHEWLRDYGAKPMFASKELMLPVEAIVDKSDGRDNADIPETRGGASQNVEAGNASPAASGGLGTGIDEGRISGAPGLPFRGSLGGGLSGHLSSGGSVGVTPSGSLNGGLGGRNRSGQPNSMVAPAWKMAPPSRAESPGPAHAATAALHQSGYPKMWEATHVGTPTANQYAAAQARTSSPFGSQPRGFVNVQRRSPSPPPRQGASLTRGAAGTNMYGGPVRGNVTHTWDDMMNQSGQLTNPSTAGPATSHTPRLARPLAVAADQFGGAAGSMPGVEYSSASSISQPPDPNKVPNLGGIPGSGDFTGSAVRAQSNTDARYSNAGELLVGGHSLGAAAPGGVSIAQQPGSTAGSTLQPRQSSPMPQALIMRPPNVRGMSPSPMRNLGGLDSAYISPQRSGSPVAKASQQQHTPTAGAAPVGTSANLVGGAAARGISGAPVASLDGSPGGGAGQHFWQSPRTASPNSGVYRAPEAYSRGRSHTRTLMPTQLVSGYSQSPTPAGVLRTSSPGQVSTRATGIAWSPVPPSPPAPKRSISPQPTGVVVPATNSALPRWNSPTWA